MSYHTSDQDNSDSKSLFLSLVPIVAFLLATVAMFLLGCFVIGPWCKNHSHTVETCTVVPPSVKYDSEDSPLPSPSRSSKAASGSEITIKEITPQKSVHSAPSSQPSRSNEVSKSSSTGLSENQSSSNPAAETNTSPTTTVGSSNADIADAPGKDTKPDLESDALTQPLHRVRAGLFADKSNADSLAAKLSSAGYVPSVHHIERDGRQLYVVQLGAFRSKENAEELAKSLRDSGFPATVIVDK